MKAIPLPLVTPLKISKLLLLGIAVGLIAIHLTITWKLGNTNLWGMSILFWAAVCSLVWKKRSTLSLQTGVFSSFCGTLLIALILLNSTSSFSYSFHFISPLISAIGLGLIASGFKGLKQYWQELLILFFLGGPQVAEIRLSDLFNISALTAKFAALVLWYLGFKVVDHGVNLNLNTGSVVVYPGCSGIETILYLFGLAVISLVMFPLSSCQKTLVPVVAIFIGFVVNGVRVALMTYLAGFSNHQVFEYWHSGDGSLIFSMIAVLIFMSFYFFLLRLDKPENHDSVEL